MADENHELLPVSTGVETALDVVAAVSSIAPWVGGPVSVVLSGMSLSRKLHRVNEVLADMARRIQNHDSEASKKYVETEEFQELLEKTLRQAADERSEKKRRIYAAFLAGTIQSPDESYDEQMRFLRTLEEMQPDHIRMLQALMQAPEPDPGSITGSVSRTLHRRLPDIPQDRIRDLAEQVTGMRVANLTNLNLTMTAQGAAELRHTITPYGHRFIKYIRASEMIF